KFEGPHSCGPFLFLPPLIGMQLDRQIDAPQAYRTSAAGARNQVTMAVSPAAILAVLQTPILPVT
ncbi:hypothetical protein, partial [Paraburkholderia caribensis]|uniref:hypothetical protein n=1 Tax=Paraburkholderia caribensis TaxID=75105 RepID=UPI0020916D5C